MSSRTDSAVKRCSSEVNDPEIEVVDVAKWQNNLVKGLSTRHKLQNSKGCAESPEFLPALGLHIKSTVTT